jgi:type IV pilus assembly protein PilB
MGKRLGEILLEKEVITEAALETALNKQQQSKEKLGEVLISLGFANEEQIYDALKDQGKNRIDLTSVDDYDRSLINMFEESYLKSNFVTPYMILGDKLIIVMNNTSNYKVYDYVFEEVKRNNPCVKKFEQYLGSKLEIIRFISKVNGGNEVEIEGEQEIFEDDKIDIEDTAATSPHVKYVNDLINQGIRISASDIHFEPQFNSDSIIRYRINGDLYKMGSFPRARHKKIIAILKVLSELHVEKKNEPQDGEIKHKYNNGYVNIRVSTIPTANGEKVVLRILGTSSGHIGIDKIGMAHEKCEQLKESLQKRRGLIIITAPTGEGKTTTLYSALKHINESKINIHTIEDPIEVKLAGVNQTQVNKTVTFATSLKAILRQDPDAIMVGEIRDEETASIAATASNTGHLVLTTLHTQDTVSVVSRLLDMKVPAYLIADCLELIICQRLVKILCHHCKVEDEESLNFIKSFHNNTDLNFENKKIYKKSSCGCHHCNQTGIESMTGIHEFLRVTNDMRYLIAKEKVNELRAMTNKENESMYIDGLKKVLEGYVGYDNLLEAVGLTRAIVKYTFSNN